MPHPYILKGALGIAVLPGIFGVSALINPDNALRGVHFPVPSDPKAHRLTQALMRIYGVRNVAVSYMLGLIWYKGDAQLLGGALLAGLGMCVTDGFVSKWLIGGGEWNHWGFAPIIIGASAALLGAFD